MIQFHRSFPFPDFPRLLYFGIEQGSPTRYPEPHHHPGAELFFFSAGEGAVELGQGLAPIPAKRGTVLLVAPGVEHHFGPRAHALAYSWFGLQTSGRGSRQGPTTFHRRTRRLKDEILETRHRDFIPLTSAAWNAPVNVLHGAHLLEPVLDAIAAEVRDPGPDSGALVETRLVELLLLLLRIRRSDTARPRDAVEHLARRAREHPGEALLLQDTAREWGMHPVYLSTRFTAAHGRGFRAYRDGERLRRAKERLASGASATATARELGFGGLQAFSAFFRRHTGKAPGRYFLNPRDA